MAKILEVKYENEADARVCEVANESQADLCCTRWATPHRPRAMRCGSL